MNEGIGSRWSPPLPNPDCHCRSSRFTTAAISARPLSWQQKSQTSKIMSSTLCYSTYAPWGFGLRLLPVDVVQ